MQSNWEHHKEVKAAQGVKIIAKELEKSLAGLPMYVAKRDDEVEYYKVQRKLFGFNVIGFRFSKNDIDINAEGVAIFTQLLIQYFGYLWKCMYLVSLKKTKTNPCPDHILSLLDSMWLEPSKKTGRSKILGQMSRSLQTVKFLT